MVHLWFSSKRRVLLAGTLGALLLGLVIFLAGTSGAPVLASTGNLFHMIQLDPDLNAMPADLNRLSWGAVLAGSLLAIMIQLSLNLLGIAVGATSIDPENQDPASPQTLATGAAVWVGLSTLISLFVGGWLAARFAGIPNQVDGLLHGMVVWALVILVSLFFLGTALGRVISGITTLLGQGLGMMGRAAQGVVEGVGTVAQGLGSAVQDAAASVSDTVDDTMRSSPEVNQAMQRLDTARDSIMEEARRFLSQAGLTPQQLENQAEGVGRDVRAAAEQVAQNPANATAAIDNALNRLFRRAQALGDAVANEADRDTILQVMRERGNMSDAQARAMLARWEQTYQQAQQEFERTRRDAGMRLQQLQREAQHKVEDVKDEAERVAREAAHATTDSVAKLAAAIFVAIIVGGFAAGIGGWFGAVDADVVQQTTSFDPTGQF